MSTLDVIAALILIYTVGRGLIAIYAQLRLVTKREWLLWWEAVKITIISAVVLWALFHTLGRISL